LRDEHSVVTHFVCLQRDLTVQKRVQDELYRLATTDPLTNIANRRAFFERGAIEVDKARRYSRPLSLVMFDIDHFKRLNDTYGHESGDVVLKGVASRALGILRQVDLLGRLGGEEFAVALPETSAKRAGEVAERLRLQIAANPYHLPNGEAFTSASFGVATLGSSHDTLETLLRRADEALYRAKGGGRNRVETRLAQVQ
jgi:diguanylate cyclase (GGDEF)-like protein